MFNFFKIMFIHITVPKANKRPIATFYATNSGKSKIPYRQSYYRVDKSGNIRQSFYRVDKRGTIARAKYFMSYMDSKKHKYGAYTA